ncbi:MAG: cell filamentation protein Fic, partial [Fibrobacteria bacterium]|nr:cell filamentation protein Fic [Fibrobacteria bacterium]
MVTNSLAYRPAGYTYLLKIFEIESIPHWHTSFISSSGSHKSKIQDSVCEEIYPKRYWPGEKVGTHLEFALKYDGVNLSLLFQLFEVIPQKDLTEYIKSKPSGKYARRVWFFYEFLTEKRLPLDDASTGNYVDALEEKEYYT